MNTRELLARARAMVESLKEIKQRDVQRRQGRSVGTGTVLIKPKKPKKKTQRQKMIDHLDALFREFIRKRAILRVHGCERCGASKISYIELDTAHNESRAHKCARWDEDNALGLCGGCHRLIDREPKEKEKLFVEAIGRARYERLDLLAHSRCKPDYQAIEIYLKQKLEEVNNEREPVTESSG